MIRSNRLNGKRFSDISSALWGGWVLAEATQSHRCEVLSNDQSGRGWLWKEGKEEEEEVVVVVEEVGTG